MKKHIAFLLALVFSCTLFTAAFAETSTGSATVVTLLQSLTSNENGILFDVSYDDASDIYYLYMQQDGLGANASLAKSDADYLEQWYTLRTSLIDLCTNAMTLVKALTSSDNPSVAVVVRNDTDTDDILLTILNSIVIYDSVDGTDLTGK